MNKKALVALILISTCLVACKSKPTRKPTPKTPDSSLISESTASSDTSTSSEATTPVRTVEIESVNARTAPSLSAELVATLQQGDKVEVLETVTGDDFQGITEWVETTIEGVKAYVWSGALSVAEPTQTVQSSSSSSAAKSTTTTSTTSTEVADLDMAAVALGDYSSLAGTWKNGQGASLVINADGTLDDGGMTLLATDRTYKGGQVLEVVASSPESQHPGGAMIALAVGEEVEGQEVSDTTQPRLLVTSITSTEFTTKDFYYKVQ